MSIIKGNKDNFKKLVLESDKKVCVDFNADWCGPCRMVGPILEEMSKERDDILFVSINVDEEEDLARDYNVFTIPCIVIIEQGKEKKRTVGYHTKEELEQLIDEE